MIRRLTLMAVVLVGISGCSGESFLNRTNWFGSREGTARVPNVVVATDNRPLVDRIARVGLERTPDGAILSATGVAKRQGPWAANLVLDGRRSSPSRLVYQFRMVPSPTPTRVSTEASREVIAGRFLTNQRLAGVREIQVLGAQSSRSIRP